MAGSEHPIQKPRVWLSDRYRETAMAGSRVRELLPHRRQPQILS